MILRQKITLKQTGMKLSDKVAVENVWDTAGPVSVCRQYYRDNSSKVAART